ncbi:hypothetical protein RR48_11315 [Papilio machaon]|uniref:Uncharacterized protein n=1 Tax=Papilio machaon TaxID=76193 RepID=A0A194QTE3_PAPMA|nr:hypothetical protein RR48_11315 [Papilio machaon]
MTGQFQYEKDLVTLFHIDRMALRALVRYPNLVLPKPIGSNSLMVLVYPALSIVCILLICVNAEHTVRCNNETNPSINSVTLVPSPDHVGGRYVIEWCTAAGANITAWEFYINYNISMNPNQCKHYNFIHDSKFAYHSHLEENTNINLNCSHVCFSTSIDLIFKACYHIKNQVIKGRVKMQSYDQLIYITNNFTNSTVLKNSAPAATSYNSDEYVSVQWFTGSVPAAKFTMNLNSVTEEVAGEGAVYDVYAAEVSAQAARAPAEWLRAVLCREEVRVVVLQTPAAACLYAAQLRQRGYTLALEQPLLGRGAAPRRPHCADALLQLALRLMCESAHAHRFPYRKYYVAEVRGAAHRHDDRLSRCRISGLEANVVPLVTPQRRYLLPAATALLLRDLAASAPPAPGAPPAPPEPPEQRLAEPLAQFSRAVEELQEYVRENPDYLNDELIFL